MSTPRKIGTADIFAPMTLADDAQADAHERFHSVTREWAARLGFQDATPKVINRALAILKSGGRLTVQDARNALAAATQEAKVTP